MNPEFCGYLAGRLLAAGALDVWWTAVQMKKGRPGLVLHVLTRPEDTARLRSLIFTESTTLGLREYRVLRYALPRESLTVELAGETVRVKVGRWCGRPVQVAPEYEDARRVAENTGQALKEVYRAATALAWAKLTAAEIEPGR